MKINLHDFDEIKEKENKSNIILKFDYDKFIKSITPMIEIFRNIANEYVTIVDNLGKFIEEYTKYVSDIIPKLNVSVTEQRRSELIDAYETWGKFGWTIIPDASMDIFNTKPNDILNANKLVEKYIKKNNIHEIFSTLTSFSTNNIDLDESIFCYNNKKYKACALIVFTIIERTMLNYQKENNIRNFKVSKSAVDELNKRINHNVGSNIFEIFPYLFILNTFSCLDEFFCHGNNFKTEGPLINRNFLCHGMSRRSVRKRDCIQLFLLLLNLRDAIRMLA